MKTEYRQITFDDSDVVNLDDWIPQGEYNPHRVRPFLFHDYGFTVAVVFADCLQDALDIATDENKMDRYKITDSDRMDYMTDDVSKMAAGFDPNCPDWTDANGKKYWWKIEPAFLGNASEPFDIESLGVVELPNPPRSFVAQFASAFPPK